MKIICAGFSRTGTVSLAAALTSLGVGRCLHPLQTVDEQPRIRTRSSGWHDELSGFDAVLGWLGARHYAELLERWPDARVLLTVRDADSWYASYASCLEHARELALGGRDGLIEAERVAREVLMLDDDKIWRGILDGSYAERESALQRLRDHNERVRTSVGSERLLVYDVADGWDPLCELLGRSVPDAPFPHLNEGRRFVELFRARPADATPVRAGAPRARTRAGAPRIAGVAVSDPERSLSQAEVLTLLGLGDDEFAGGVFERCAVERRQLDMAEQVPDGLQARAALAEQRLFEHAVTSVDRLDVDPREVGAVVTASLYSLAVPSLAHRLAEHYGMDASVDKYHLTAVGCASAVPLMRLAQDCLRGREESQALVVAAESMSGLLTPATAADPRAKIVGSAIFGDGCAAAVLDGRTAASGPAIVDSAVHQIPATLGAVRMEVSALDSYLHLDRDLPDVAAAGLRPLVDDFLSPHGLTALAIDHWIVHPGGRRILECVQAALSLSDSQVAASYEVLANHGNIGTPTIFYVLDRVLKRPPAPGARGLMVTVGPGITVGLMLLRF